MAQQDTDLPERTNRVIPGAMKTSSDVEAELIMNQDELQTGTAGDTTGNTKRDKVVAKVNETRRKVATEAAGKTRGMVGDGLHKGSEAIGNVSRLVDDTATSIDEQLGAEYGDYARRTARYLDDTAQRIAAKDPDELIEDVRGFVKKSPGIALGAAAIVGFGLARLVTAGFDAERDEFDDDLSPTRDPMGDPAGGKAPTGQTADPATAPVDPVVTPRR